MIPVGYMAKRVISRPDWISSTAVTDIHSVSGCVSEYFADYINWWKHNQYFYFDSVEAIRQLAAEHSVDLLGCKFFFYEMYEEEFDDKTDLWRPALPTFDSQPTNVARPISSVLEGFDVVSFSMQSTPECSPLSCNSLSAEVTTNQHCLLESLEVARQLLIDGRFRNTEPGPFRIFSVSALSSEAV